MYKSNVILIYFIFLNFLCSCETKAQNCYERQKKVGFDKIDQFFTTAELEGLRNWYFTQRSKDDVIITYFDTSGNKLRILIFLEDCKFKNLYTQNIFSFNDSALYKNEIDVGLINKAYAKLHWFLQIDVSHIIWSEESNRVLFTLEQPGNHQKTIYFDMATYEWKKYGN